MDTSDVARKAKELVGKGSLFIGRTLYDGTYDKGYNDAAMVCLDLIEYRINTLIKRMQTDKPLSEKEQYALSTLKNLKDDMNADLQSYINS
jgi:hypothetical protein